MSLQVPSIAILPPIALIISNPNSFHPGGRQNTPGSTYYLQKVSHDLFGITDHSTDTSVMYLFDERIGSKNTNHTISLLTHFWQRLHHQHPWIRRLSIFLDNATSTNSKKFLFSWAMEMVSRSELDHLHISFMVADHTKFAPDRLFFCDRKCIQERGCIYYQAICDQCATEDVYTWRDALGIKYSDLSGVRRYHDFLVVKTNDGRVVMKVREKCYSGE